MPQFQTSRIGAIVLLASSIGGLLVALYAYFTPLTGVTGSLGALAAVLVTALLAVLALALCLTQGTGAHNGLRVLAVLALFGIACVGALLHEWWLCLAMLVGLLGLIVDVFKPARTAGPAY